MARRARRLDPGAARRPRGGAGRALIRVALALLALLAAPAFTAAQTPEADLARGRVLIERNCGDCMGATRPALEEGVAAVRRALDTGALDRAGRVAAYRLLAQGLSTLAWVHVQPDSPEQARLRGEHRKALDQLVGLAPTDPDIRYEHAMAQPDEHGRLLNLWEVLTLDPRHANARFTLGRILAARGRRAEALVELARAAEAAPENHAEVYRRALDQARNAPPASPPAPITVAPAKACRRNTIHGNVTRGQRFERAIGDGLVFRLTPHLDQAGAGWTITVVRPPREDEDFSSVMTPPHRGINPRFIEGWHFRNLDNTGINLGDVNAPQDRREFAFVLTRPDYLRAADSLDRLLWRRPGDTDHDREGARLTLEQVPVGEGAVHIYALDLGRLVPGQRAVIDDMSFELELCLPAVAPARPTCSLEEGELRCSDGRRFPVSMSSWERLDGRAPDLSLRGSRSLEVPNGLGSRDISPDGERLEGPDGLECVTHRGHVHCNR